MSVEENKALNRRYIEEIWNKGDMRVVDEIVATEFIHHNPEDDLNGPEEFKQYVSSSRSGFPDIQFIIKDQVAERDTVVTRWIMTATHKGEFMGIAATNKKVSVPGVSITRVEEGKVVENWAYWDRLGFMQQLGVISLPGEKK